MKAPSYLDAPLRRKRRRNSSPGKQTEETIHFSIDQNKKVLPALTAAEDANATVAFSDRLLCYTHAGKLKLFQIVITHKYVHLFKDKSGKEKECFQLKDIDTICLSHQSDNFMLIKLKGGKPAVLLCSTRKSQIVQVIAHQTGNESANVPLSVTDRFSFLHADGKKYVIVFTRTEFGVQTSLYRDSKEEQSTNVKKKKHK